MNLSLRLQLLAAVVGDSEPSAALATAINSNPTIAKAFAAAQSVYSQAASTGTTIPWAQILTYIEEILAFIETLIPATATMLNAAAHAPAA